MHARVLSMPGLHKMHEMIEVGQMLAPDHPAQVCQLGVGVADAVGLPKLGQQPQPGPRQLQALRPALLRLQSSLQHQVIYLHRLC